MTVAILISITCWDGLSPGRTALEVDVLDVGASVDNVYVNALTAVGAVKIFVECAKGETVAVRDTSQAPWRVLLRLGGVF